MKRQLTLLACLVLVVAMVCSLASCDLIDKITGKPSEEHTHSYVDGKCECGESDPNYVAPHTHNFVEGKCECGETDPNYVPEVPECTEHAYGAPEVTKEATCTEPGEKKLTCSVCGHSETLEIAPNGHTEETVAGKAPTCTEAGLSNGKKCSVCGEVLVAQAEIAATGHTFVEGSCACGEVDPEYNGPRTYVLDVQNLAAFAQGAKADGDTEVVGDFFTIYYSAKTKIDTTKNKTWPDGYTFAEGLRLNWGGTTAINDDVKDENDEVIGYVTKNAIEIVVDGTATVKVWWICGGDGREIGIFDENGDIVVASQTDDVFTEGTEGVGAGKNGVYLSELTLSKSGKYYIGTDNTNAIKNGGNIICKVEVVVTPAEEVETEGSLNVETTDTYCNFCDADLYTFTANASGTYTFTVPAGLGVHSKEAYDAWKNPEVDFNLSPNGGEFSVDLAEGESFVFHVAAATKADWVITWTFAEGEVEGPGSDDPVVEIDTELELGNNLVYVAGDSFGSALECTFVVTEEGTYSFTANALMAVIVIDETTSYRGSAYLTPGTYTVNVVYYTSTEGYEELTISYEAPASGEPDGSEQYPFVWETLPESVTFESDNMNMVYYVFTATADGSITFTWAVEGNDWFNYFELVDGQTTENNGSGFAKTSHTFVVETGKTYRIGLGTWNEGGETVVSIAFNACAHVWSEATCTTPSTCATCGATTGDLASHTSSGEATCQNPEVCTVCGFEMSTVDHTWGEPTDVVNPDCSTMTNGSQKLTCTVCGHEETETLWASHDLDYSQSVDATCTENGKYHAVCTVCGYEESSVIEAQGHYNWYATCGDTTNCMECGVEFTVEHNTAFSPATCTQAAYCMNCWSYVGEPAGHSYDATGLCTACGETVKLVIAGSEGFFGSNWSLESEDNLLSYADGVFTKTYISTSEGIYQFKVIDITAANNWDHAYPSNNYYFYVDVDYTVVVTFDFATKALTVAVSAPNSDVVTDGTTYMVVGDKALCGDIDPNGGDWGWETNNYDNLLTLNADGKYELVYTGVAAGTYGIKVVKNGDYSVAEWGDNGANYSIVVAENGSVVTILFDPAAGTISHNVHVHSYFYPCDKVCQECFEESNPNASHTIVAVEAKAATCTENGNIAYWYCSDCGYAWADEALKQQTNQRNVVIPAAHTYTYACDKACAVCYEITNESATHTIVAVEAKTVTCTENGNIAYWYCSDCGYAWADEALTQQTNLMSVTTPALGHDYVEGICSNCNGEDPDHYFVVSIADALAKDDGKKVQISGVVISAEAWNTKYNNMSVTIKDANGDSIYIFRLATQVGLGDTITVKGTIGSYNNSKQIAAGATAVIDVVHGDNHTYADGVCTVCGSKEPVAGETTTKCDFSTVSGTQYADETNTFGDLTVSTHNKGCHFNTQLRIYDSTSNNGWAIVYAGGKTITDLKINMGYKKATLNVYGSVDGETWVLIQAVATTSTSYLDYTVDVDDAAGYKYLKLDASGAQIRIPSIEVSYKG